MPISRRDLVDDLLGAHPELTRKAATAFVSDLFATLAAGLRRGDSVRLAGFGSFSVRERKARTARSPRDGKPVQVPASKAVRFKAAKALKTSLNAPAKKKKSG